VLLVQRSRAPLQSVKASPTPMRRAIVVGRHLGEVWGLSGCRMDGAGGK
jgi:hypothetical protein